MIITTEFNTMDKVFIINRGIITEEEIKRIDIVLYEDKTPHVEYVLYNYHREFKEIDMFRTRIGAGERLLADNGLTVELKEIK